MIDNTALSGVIVTQWLDLGREEGEELNKLFAGIVCYR